MRGLPLSTLAGPHTATVSVDPPPADDIMRTLREFAESHPSPRAHPLASFGIGPFAPPGALRIIEDRNMVETVEGWSEVRSPSRAARRRRQGHRQRIRYVVRPKREAYEINGALVMRPDIARTVEAEIAQRESADGLRFQTNGGHRGTLANGFHETRSAAPPLFVGRAE